MCRPDDPAYGSRRIEKKNERGAQSSVFTNRQRVHGLPHTKQKVEGRKQLFKFYVPNFFHLYDIASYDIMTDGALIDGIFTDAP